LDPTRSRPFSSLPPRLTVCASLRRGARLIRGVTRDKRRDRSVRTATCRCWQRSSCWRPRNRCRRNDWAFAAQPTGGLDRTGTEPDDDPQRRRLQCQAKLRRRCHRQLCRQSGQQLLVP
jgi:hypothetical protein